MNLWEFTTRIKTDHKLLQNNNQILAQSGVLVRGQPSKEQRLQSGVKDCLDEFRARKVEGHVPLPPSSASSVSPASKEPRKVTIKLKGGGKLVLLSFPPFPFSSCYSFWVTPLWWLRFGICHAYLSFSITFLIQSFYKNSSSYMLYLCIHLLKFWE